MGGGEEPGAPLTRFILPFGDAVQRGSAEGPNVLSNAGTLALWAAIPSLSLSSVGLALKESVVIRRLISSIAVAALVSAAVPSTVKAQHAGGSATRVLSVAPAEAEQFAFLVGRWEVKVTPKATTLATRIHGVPKLTGVWKAWRAVDGFGIEDELRIVDGSGNPNSLSHTMRVYAAAQGKWTQTAIDVYRVRWTTATGEWKDGAMQLRSAGRDAEGNAYVQRVRFYDITPTTFKYQADRSMDGERTWETAVLRMEATRVAATAPR